MRRRFPVTFNSPVVLIFVFLCLIVTGLGVITGDRSTELLFMTYRTSFTDPMAYVRLFTHVLGHSGWEHFVSNATYLLLLGPMLEEKYGSRVLVAVIAMTAVVTGLANTLLFPNTALCGASGVVFAFIILSSFTGSHEGEIPLTFLLVAVIFIGQQIYQGVIAQDEISQLTHILGGIVGAVMGYFLNGHRMPKGPHGPVEPEERKEPKRPKFFQKQ